MNYKSAEANSPLLVGNGLPDYKHITHNEVNKQIPNLLKILNGKFTEFEFLINNDLDARKTLGWEEVMDNLHEINESLGGSWGVVSHLNGVCNSNEFRSAYAKQQPEIIHFINRVGQSKVLYNALNELLNKSKSTLNKTQKRIIEAEIISMDQRGVGLDSKKQEQFNIDSARLAKLSTNFSNNVLDATKEWSLLLNQPSEVKGLPPRALEILAKRANDNGDVNQKDNSKPTPEKGPWRVGLESPTYIPFMTYCSNRHLREVVYKAHVKRASEGKVNNQENIKEILILRRRQAKRLGYINRAEVSLATKMAKDVNAVEELLEELRSAAYLCAKKEIKKLQTYAESKGFNESSELAPWDISFWAEKLKEERFNLNQEELRPWFPLPNVLDGLFQLSEKLFGIKIEAADGEAPIWDPEVRYFRVKDSNNSLLASFFLDPYSRPENKRGGAWMDECLNRSKSKNGEIVLPVAYLVCNQTPPIEGKPSLMSFEEVRTLFHEFGHGLQHMLTTVDYPQAAGINNVEWDAVELPSQFMENWCFDKQTLLNLSSHWETGNKLPEKEFKKIERSRNFNSGLATLRQVHFALTDIRLHSVWDEESKLTPDEIRREIAISTTIIPPINEDNFLCTFSHIFAGGYSAGYYSYKWAEVLSADAFSAFEEVGLSKDSEIRSIGRKFRETILSLGGSLSPEIIFELFRGRSAKTDALIRHSGLNKK